ncbi:MAG TPA: hypothetical protein VK738_11670 [Terriglobales bacterium]|nr:hypothetical protein [Terriglobales bacterium]
MTIVAGFSCADGIMLCADTEETISDTNKSSTEKLQTVTAGNVNILLGGAGSGDLIDFVSSQIFADFASNDYMWEQIPTVLNAHAKRVFNEHIRPYRGFPPNWIPELNFLIAIQSMNRCRLFKWTNNFVSLVSQYRHDSIGIGTVQSRVMMNEMQFSVPSEQMVFYATRLMQKVKSQVVGCGGKTDIMVLKNDGMRHLFSTEFIERMEKFAIDLDQYFLTGLDIHITAPPGTAAKEIEFVLKDSVNLLKQFRNRYVELWAEPT